MSDTPLLAFRDVRKVYGKGDAAVVALDGINLSIDAGEFVAVLGPSGSGKSTAMNILGCLDTPTAGQYFFRGVDVASLSRDQRALLRRNFIGFVFQGFNLLKRTSALENLELPLLYRGTPAQQRHALARDALSQVGLSGWDDHTPSELSGGQQQRIAIARALITNPEVIFADEPTGNLDRATGESIVALFKQLAAEKQIAILLTTHNLALTAAADRVITLEDGRIQETS